MPLSDTIDRALLSAEERSSIAEIEATTNILQLVTRMTGTRFAAIAKFTDTDWIVCSAFDPIELGINTGDTLELRIGHEVRTVVIRGLSGVRAAAPVAALLFEETAASLAQRAANAEMRRLAPELIGRRRLGLDLLMGAHLPGAIVDVAQPLVHRGANPADRRDPGARHHAALQRTRIDGNGFPARGDAGDCADR